MANSVGSLSRLALEHDSQSQVAPSLCTKMRFQWSTTWENGSFRPPPRRLPRTTLELSMEMGSNSLQKGPEPGTNRPNYTKILSLKNSTVSSPPGFLVPFSQIKFASSVLVAFTCPSFTLLSPRSGLPFERRLTEAEIPRGY